MSVQRARPALLLIGVGFLIYTIHATGGFDPMAEAMAGIGWWFLPAFAATVIAQWLRTAAWGRLFEHDEDRPSMAALWRARLIGESLNYLTFAGPLIGDPARAAELKSETGCNRTLATVGVDRLLYALASCMFIAIAGLVWLQELGWLAAFFCLALACLSPAIVRRFGFILKPRTTLVVVALHFLSNVFMAVEAAILLKGLGLDFSIHQSSAVEALAKGLNGVFFFLPMQIGVTEAGNVMLLKAMDVGATVGLALGLARRVRSIAWSMAGLALMV